MNHKQAYLGIAVFMLIVSCCFVPTVISENSLTSEETNPITPFQEQTYENMSITLQEPIDTATIDTKMNISFIFYPAINGSDQLAGASLWVNGSRVSYNQTTVVPWQNNTIYHQVSTNGTYLWSIKLENSTQIIQSEEFTLTVAVPEDTEISVVLKTPANNANISNNLNVSFVFIPRINGSDQLTGASLYIDGSRVEDNQTALVAGQENTIHYLFSGNGSHRWNIKLYNSTNFVFSPDSNNFTLAVNPSTSPTPTPTPKPTTNPTTSPTATPHTTVTPTPTPGPEMELDLWTLIIVAGIVFAVVLIVTIFLLKRRAR